MKKIPTKTQLLFLILLSCFTGTAYSQSANCATATSITIGANPTCVNGTSAGALTDNTLYGTCNSAPVDMVWYTYVTAGSNNNFTVTPGTLTNAEIVIYLTNCPASGGVLQICNTATGSAPVSTLWGIPQGTQVWVGVASNGGNDGTFQLCISSVNPAPTGGQLCSTALPICSQGTYNQATMTGFGSSGQTPSCFVNPTQQDIFFQFTVTQSGVLAWKGTPNNPATEYDWCLWNITSSCPGTEVCCNYNFAGGSSSGFGMENQAGNVACGYNLASFVPSQDFSPTVNVTAGQTYAIQISNYSNDNNGFSLAWTNSTCKIAPNAAFTINPSTFTCGTSVTVNVTNTSIGGPQTWNFGDGSATYTGTTPPAHLYSSPGTYAITENIPGACPSSATQFVKLYGPLAALSASTISNCSPCNGTANVSGVTGGDGNYTYAWTPSGGTNPSATALCAGTYTCTISNAACGTSLPKVITVGAQPSPTASIPSSANIVCNGACNGTATGSGSGGTGPYTYAWTPSGGNAATASALCPNTYTCTVTDSKGCTGTQTVTLTQPAAIVANPTQTNATCNGTATGTATVAPTGGTPNYTYSWTPAISVGGGGTTSTATGLAAGTYTCTITDSKACTGTQTVTITQPAPIAANPTQTNVACNGGATGSATVAPTGGTPTFNYSWIPAASIGGGGTTATATGLGAGTYTCAMVDSKGCVDTQTVVITQPAPLAITPVQTTQTACTSATGKASVNVTGGNPTYNYVWSPAPGAGQSTPSASAMAAGTYVLTVTDASSCPQTYTVSITAAGAPTSTLSASSNVKCNAACTGSATISVSGGTPPLTYSWSSGAGTSPTATSLCAQPYTCTVTDSNGCVTTQTVTITQPAALAITPSQTNVNCNGNPSGAAVVSVSGGVPGTGYTYLWTPNPTTGQGTPTASGLSAGPISCAVTDSNGCSITHNFTITQPAVLSASGAPTNATCSQSNGQATANATGGSGTYTYAWTPSPGTGQGTPTAGNLPGAIYQCIITDSLGCTATVTDTVKNLGTNPNPAIQSSKPMPLCAPDSALLTASGAGVGGVYTWMPSGSHADSIYVSTTQVVVLSVTNSCGTATKTDSITAYSVPVPIVTGGSTVCAGTKDTLHVTSTPVTKPPTTFLWNTGATTSTLIVTTPGTYTATATNMCGSASSTTVVSNYLITAEFGSNVNTGAMPLPVNFTDSSSTTAVSWSWNFGDGGTASGQNPNHTYPLAGTYTVTETVVDVHGCKSTDTEIINVQELPSWLIVPNVFTPNGDGKNDDWHVLYQGISQFHAKIYDRWGILMRELLTVDQGWDGRTDAGLLSVSGTYYYLITAQGDDGRSYDLKGFLELIRQ